MKQLSVFFLAAVLILSACRRDSDDRNSFVNTSQDVSDMETTVQNADMEVDAEIQAFTANQDCPTITWQNPEGTYPNTVTIDYGTEGCEGPHGHVRKGIIEVSMTAPMSETGAVRTLTFVSYSVDDIQVQGVRTITNTGLNVDGQPTYSRVMTDGSLTWPDGSTATWQNTTNATMTEGYGDMIAANNKWQITGSASGINKNGKNWTALITTPIIRKYGCPWPVVGVRAITVEDNELSLDYGFGTGESGCDRKAELTLPNGNTIIVNVRF